MPYADPERQRAYQRTWARKKRRAGRGDRTAERRSYEQRNRDKKRAHKAVYRALRNGTLTRPNTCSTPDATCAGRIVAHHDDYTKPLDVRWLCVRHHAEHHRRFP